MLNFAPAKDNGIRYYALKGNYSLAGFMVNYNEFFTEICFEFLEGTVENKELNAIY